MSTFAPPQRYPSRNIASNGNGYYPRQQQSSHNKKGGCTLTMIVGLSLSLLMASYVVIIFMVAVVHWPTTTINNNSATSSFLLRHHDNANQPNETPQQRWERIKEERGLERNNNNNNQANANNNNNHNKEEKADHFHLYELDKPLDHGVRPEVLIPHDSKNDPITAIKDDPPPDQHPTPEYVLTAYLEKPNFEDWNITPLPIRRHAKAEELQVIRYPRLNSCTRLPQQFPVDDTPVDQDAFLPWIHDVFPTHDGKFIQIVAQNKRRCKNGSAEKDILHQQQPQASLFQHVSVERTTTTTSDEDTDETRYRLCPDTEADPDGVVTRFICRFKPDGTETLSVFNFNYDWTAFRKKYKSSFMEEDAGIKAIHSSQLIFKCPVPEHLQDVIASGTSVKNDWATLFLDIIPIRTPPRWGPPDQYFPPMYKDMEGKDSHIRFDPVQAWGHDHILPRIEDSGRWENIPICKPSLMTYEQKKDLKKIPASSSSVKKSHRLVSCIWASAGYTTRGSRFAINDGQRRLLEWITYNKIIGFDHFYLYDNSGAFGGESSLKPIADLFPDDVTYIPWPSAVCNNNPNNVDSVGERSSQYAAESSCRLRFGPHVDWIGQFDIDEYLVPMGKHKKITELLDTLDKEGTKIISFASWRAWPRMAFIEEPIKIDDPTICWHNEPCFELKIPYEHTMLQSYNCDRQKPGQKKESMPAEKQVYRPDYVLSHFVHYSVATVQSEKNYTEYTKDGFQWKPRAFPDPRQRFGDEINEGLMIHTKAVARQDTSGWERMCHINNSYLAIRKQGLCRLGVPFPDDWTLRSSNATSEGWAYNCYVNHQVEDFLVPQLEKQLSKHADFFRIK